MIEEGQRGKDLWKFNSSVLSNKNFVRNMKHHITTTTVFLNEENTLNDQIACEYLKFEIRKFSIHFSVSKAKKSNNNNNNKKKKWKL